MKTMMRKIATLLIVTAFACVGLVGCGAISIDEIKGDWTMDSINGQSMADYAAGAGLDVNMVYVNWTINDDNTITSTNVAGTGTIKMELKSNGFEATEEASGGKFSVEYDKDAGTLTYKVDQGGTVNTCVMKKGTFTPSAAEEPAEEEPAAEEPADDGSEEEILDEGSEDESYDEEATDESYDEGSEDESYDEEETE